MLPPVCNYYHILVGTKFQNVFRYFQYSVISDSTQTQPGVSVNKTEYLYNYAIFKDANFITIECIHSTLVIHSAKNWVNLTQLVSLALVPKNSHIEELN